MMRAPDLVEPTHSSQGSARQEIAGTCPFQDRSQYALDVLRSGSADRADIASPSALRTTVRAAISRALG